MSEIIGATTGPDLAEVLARVAERLDRIEGVLSRLENIAEQAPVLAAVATDTFDEACRRAGANGIDVSSRLGRVLGLLGRLSEPGTLDALERLVDRMPQLSELTRKLDELPGLVGMLVDLFDEWAAGFVAQGIDPATSLRQGLHAAMWLGQRVSETELERLGILLRSDVLEPHALAVVGKTGRALAVCHEGACDTAGPERMGPIGLARALFDPDVQSSLAFVVRVARCFGSHLPEPADIPASRSATNVPIPVCADHPGVRS